MEFEEYQKIIVGRMLTNLFFTKQDGPYDYMPGISPAYYFSTILELDYKLKLRFGSDFIVEWKDEEPLIALTTENWELPPKLILKGQRIIDLTKDEFDHLTFHLENGTTIAHTNDYGDQLFVENPSVSDSEDYKQQIVTVNRPGDVVSFQSWEDYKQQITTTNRSLSMVRKWWKKLLGI